MATSGNPAVDAGLAAGGLAADYFTGKSARKASKEMMRAQRRILDAQGQTYKAAMPTYQAMLAQGAQAAGIGPNGQQIARPFGPTGSQWGSQEDQLRFAAGQDQINQMAQQRQNMLQHTLAQRGIASSSVGAALAQNQRSSMRDLAGFHRQLAIDAPHEAERRRAALMGLLNPAFGQGAQASAGYGQQGAQYGAEAQNAYNAIGQGAQSYMQQRALAQYGRQPGGSGGDAVPVFGQGGQGYPYRPGGGYGPGVTGYDANRPFALGDGSYVMPDGSTVWP